MPDLPDWQSLDEAPLAAPSAGRVVAVVATESAVSGGWGGSAAVQIARAWAAQGTRIVLADTALDHPSLHDVTGVPNREGISDATLYGASLERVVQTPSGEPFLLVSAGTPVADPGAVARDGRWHRIIGSLGEAGATLVTYLHAGDGSTAAFLGSASDIIVLADADEAAPPVIRDLEPLVRAVTGPGAGGARGGTARADEAAAAAPATAGAGGMGKMILFVVLAIVVAAALGLFLASGAG